jgi:hypothetical protein
VIAFIAARFGEGHLNALATIMPVDKELWMSE